MGVALGRRFYANYFIQMLPPMALLGAVGALRLWKGRHLPAERRTAKIVSTAFLVSFVWFHARTLAHVYFLFSPEAHDGVQVWGMCRENRKVVEVARHLESRTDPGDRIFVWGSKSELYFLSKRAMATAFMDFDVGADVPQQVGVRPGRPALPGVGVEPVVRDVEDPRPDPRVCTCAPIRMAGAEM